MRRMPVLLALDKDKDGQLSAEEIADAAKALQTVDNNGDGKLTIEELRPSAGRNGRDRGSRGGGRAGNTAAPKVGELAPDFELTYVKQPEKRVRLSSFRSKQPVALIFGSCT